MSICTKISFLKSLFEAKKGLNLCDRSVFSLSATHNHLLQGHEGSFKGKGGHKRSHERHHDMAQEKVYLKYK